LATNDFGEASRAKIEKVVDRRPPDFAEREARGKIPQRAIPPLATNDFGEASRAKIEKVVDRRATPISPSARRE
jgi:hypothetical protein